ncbi:MAG: hypothetical protein LC737_07410, partial [Chloroflexi bacterium]|nr:hypothetical protein [Chloroflexota bacterium]
MTFDAADAQRSWERDAMHFPHALTPLAGDYVGDAIVSGFNYRLERHRLRLRIHGRIVNGYVYLSDEMLFAPAEREQAMQLMQQARRTQATLLRAYWDHKVMPTLQSAYQWMRESASETCSLMELAEQWDQLWQHIRHIYGLHFMCNSGSYGSLNQLADLYESFTPDAK